MSTSESPSWDDLRILLEVHRRQSFLAAGVALTLSTSTVSRRIEALERDVGHPLVQRTSRGAFLERDALPLVAVAERLERSLAALRRDGGARSSAYAGVVRVSLPDGFGPAAAIAAARVRRVHPEVHVEVAIESRFVDLASRAADIGVRGGRSTSSALLERPLGDVHAALYASRDYLAKRLPHRFLGSEDFATQDFISDVHTGAGGASGWLRERGATSFPFCSSSIDACVTAAEQGMGLVRLAVGTAPSYPTLVRVTLERPLPPIRLYLTIHRDLRKVPRIRAVAAALREVFREYVAREADEEARFARRSSRSQAR